MAAFQGVLQHTADIALSAATAATVLQLVAAANHRVKVLAWGVSFDGTVSSNEPVAVELMRQTDAGTTSALTAKKVDDSLGETLQTAGRHTATAEPTGGDVLERYLIHPQSGFFKQYPLGAEIVVGGGDRLGIRCTAPNAVNCTPVIHFEE